MGRGDGISRRQSLPPIFYNSIQSHSNTKADTAPFINIKAKAIKSFQKGISGEETRELTFAWKRNNC